MFRLFHVLAIVNSVAVTLGLHVSFWIMPQKLYAQYICPVGGLLGLMVVLFLVFKGTSILFSIVALSICIPTKSASSVQFSR